MRIVTGYRGEPHIVSDDLQAFNKGAIGDVILPIGNCLHAELTTSNNLRIYDGFGWSRGHMTMYQSTTGRRG